MPGRAVNLGQPVNTAHPLNRRLVSWWLTMQPPYSGGTRFLDLCGRNHGTLTNGPQWAGSAGRPNGARNLELTAASSQYVAIANSPTIGAAFPGFTLSYWLNIKSIGGSGNFDAFASVGYVADTIPWVSDISFDTTSLRFGMYNPGTLVQFTRPANGVPTHITGTIDGANVTLYYNGVQVAQSASTDTPAATTQPIGIGYAPALGRYANAYIDDVRVQATALRAADVMALYRQALLGHPETLNRVRGRAFGYVAAGGTFGDGAGSSTITFAPTGDGSSLWDATASSTVTFTPTGDGSSLADAAASSTLTFTPTGDGSSLADSAGSTSFAFSPTGTGSSLWDAAGATSVTFTPTGDGSSLADSAGTTTLTFTVTGDYASPSDGGGSSSLSFTVTGTASALWDAVGASTLALTVAGVGSSLWDAIGTAGVTFTLAGVGDDGIEHTFGYVALRTATGVLILQVTT